jgi:hypothetical protein
MGKRLNYFFLPPGLDRNITFEIFFDSVVDPAFWTLFSCALGFPSAEGFFLGMADPWSKWL